MGRIARWVRARGLWALAAVLVALATVTLSVGCGSQKKVAAQAKPMQLKVMEFNIEYGGTLVDFNNVAAAIKVANPDVVGLEEAETNTPRLAKLLGWPYFNSSMQIVSKYPILEPSGANGVYAFIVVQPGHVVALANIHLPSDPYGPYWVRDGKTVAQVLAMERKVRLPAIAKQLQVLPQLARKGIPAFITGDFNSPSYLDWTQAAVGSRKYVKYTVEWPVSKALADAGFRDSYREVHPDPLKDPGLTWWAARPKVADWAGNPTAADPQDRIDFIYAAGPSKALASQIVGEVGNPAVSLSVSPWPSDHRATVSTFEVTPATMPVLVATDKWLVTIGDQLAVTVHAEGAKSVDIVPAGGDPKTASVKGVALDADADETTPISTADLKPGAYDAVLTGAGGAELARTPFWVAAKGAKVELTVDKATYKSGEPIKLSWKNAPANRWDWLGVYKAGAADPNTDSYLIWQYTGGAMAGTVHGLPAGTLSLDATAQGAPWPLPAGKYVVYYLLADAYQSVAKASFTVTK